MAQLVARNIAVETMTDPQPPAFGTAQGDAVNGGRRWRWTRTVSRSPEARIQQIEILVQPEAGGPGRASLTIFRRGPV
jgi:general secretion pathway protein I